MPTRKIGKLKEKQFDFILFITVLIMLALGIIMVLSASSPSSLAEGNDGYSYLKTQGLAALGGLVLMYIISKYDYKRYKKLDKLAYGLTIVLLFAVRIPGLGHESGGAWRWIWLIPNRITFQPSEFAKIALVIFFASYLTDNRDKLRRKQRRLLDTNIKVSSSNNFNISYCAKPF
ncbi:MAG: FtsW/RodA/SpoVE family cell cycle protein [Clostridia bacterium]|nr:FtsW/RodA/SpoVE family cell cycle protein [Clostridia bacterium]